MYPNRERCTTPIGAPRQRTAPASSSTSPNTARIAVVFPAPFGPRKPVSRPGRAVNVHASSARTDPKHLLAISNSSMAFLPTRASLPSANRQQGTRSTSRLGSLAPAACGAVSGPMDGREVQVEPDRGLEGHVVEDRSLPRSQSTMPRVQAPFTVTCSVGRYPTGTGRIARGQGSPRQATGSRRRVVGLCRRFRGQHDRALSGGPDRICRHVKLWESTTTIGARAHLDSTPLQGRAW